MQRKAPIEDDLWELLSTSVVAADAALVGAVVVKKNRREQKEEEERKEKERKVEVRKKERKEQKYQEKLREESKMSEEDWLMQRTTKKTPPRWKRGGKGYFSSSSSSPSSPSSSSHTHTQKNFTTTTRRNTFFSPVEPVVFKTNSVAEVRSSRRKSLYLMKLLERAEEARETNQLFDRSGIQGKSMAETFDAFHQPFRTNGMHFSQISGNGRSSKKKIISGNGRSSGEKGGQRRMPTAGVVAGKVVNALENLKRRRASLVLVGNGSDDESVVREEGEEGEGEEERSERQRAGRTGRTGRTGRNQKNVLPPWTGTTRRATMFRTTGQELPQRLQKKKQHRRGDVTDGKFVHTSVDVSDRPSYVVECLGPRLFLRMHRNGKCEVLTSPNSKKSICLDYASSGETRWAFENRGRR